MTHKRIYLDDERSPKTESFDHICRNKAQLEQVIDKLIANKEQIGYISFDHDLGEYEPTGMDITKYLCSVDIEYNILSNDYTFNVHSANPVGAENIRCYMNNYLNFKEGNT